MKKVSRVLTIINIITNIVGTVLILAGMIKRLK